MLLAALEVTCEDTVTIVHGVKLDETVDVTGIQDFVPVVDLDVKSGIIPDGVGLQHSKNYIVCILLI